MGSLSSVQHPCPINSSLWKTTSRLNPVVVEMVGWPDLAAQVASIYQSIPDNEKSRTAILAGNYGEAGALDLKFLKVNKVSSIACLQLCLFR